MSDSVTVTAARQDFAEIVNRVAYGKERVTVARRGRDLVAIVPISDVLMLEAIEDELDLSEAREALVAAEGEPRIPLAEVLARPGR